jgi:hypothetical protein
MRVETVGVMSDRAPVGLTVVTGLWLLAVGFGLLTLLRYSYSPGEVGVAPNRWPGQSKPRFVGRKPNLIMFLHPKCPCSRASVREFEEIVARCRDLVHGQIVFVQPKGVSAEWVKTDLWDAATAIRGVTVSIDLSGRSAQRFGARTSGHTFLFDSNRELVFSGGITASRGHEGDSTGRSSVVEFLRTDGRGHNEQTLFPVFGCPLL